MHRLQPTWDREATCQNLRIAVAIASPTEVAGMSWKSNRY